MRNFKNLSKKEKAEYLAMLFLYPLFLLFRQLGNVCKFFEQKKRQLIASVLSFAVIVGSVPVLSLTTFAASGHTHCLCGATHTAIGDHKTEARTTFTAWEESTKLPYEGGTYYLTTNVTLSSPWFPEIGKSYTICLNGHSIQGSNFDSKWYSDNGVIYARENVKLTICDCVGSGSVSSDSACDVSGLLVDAGYKTKPVVNIFGGSYLNNKRDGIKVGDGFVNIYKATIKKNTHYGISSLTRDSNVLNIYNAEITQNGGTSIDGGGIYHRLGTCNFYNGKVTNNNTNYRGGGVYNGGTFNFFGGEISGNTTNTPGDDSNEYGGGGIYNYGTLNVSGGKISNNRTNKSGGGICNYGNSGKAEVNISGGEITGNYSRDGGGGVYLSYNGKSFNMSGGTISNNTASGSGGGVFASKTNPLVMTGGKIIKNSTGYNGGGVVVSSYLKISGDAEINSNYYSGNNSKSNIFLVGKSTEVPAGIRVAGKLTGGEFGVDVNDVQNLNRALVQGVDYTMTQEDADKFVSEYSGYETIFKNSKVYLRKIPENLTAEDFNFTPPTDLIYDGNAKSATVTSTKVTEQDKITVKYYDKDGEKLSGAPIMPGTYTVSIDVAETEGYNAIAGLKSDEWKFTISSQQLNESDITVSGLESQYLYTGSAVKPSFEVQIKGEPVAADSDKYTVFYGKNIKGEGSVTVSLNSKYGYIGSRTFTFNIDYGTADDTMYIMPAANENGWYNGEIEIPAAEGYKISRTDNNFSNRVIISNESDNGSVVVYLKSISTGEIYKGTINYKIDKTAPTDIKVSYNQSVFKKILNTISFGLFYRENVSVEAKAEDTLSGVDKVLYYAADSQLTFAEQNNVDWVESLTLTPNCKKIIYVKVIDKAGNQVIANDQGVVLYGDSTVKVPDNQFDLNTEKSDYVKVKIIFNGNTLKQIKNGGTVLAKDTDYIDDFDIMYIAPKYLKQFNEGDEVTLTFTFNPMGVEGSVVTETDVKIKIIDTTDYHRTATKTEYKAPKCLETGNETYWHCDVCGKYFADNNGVLDASKAYDNTDKFVIGALGHDFAEEIADNDHLISTATCLDKAVYCYDCSRCDEKDESKTYEYGNPLGHDFTEEKVDNDHLISVATCLDKAVYCYDCSRCDEKDESKTYEYGNPLGHNFTEKIIDNDHLVKSATCLEPAVYCFDCSRCDEKDASKTYTNGNPLGHKHTNYIYNGDATYFANGTETADCDHSGCTVKDTRECQNSKLIDSIAPKAEITLGENRWNTILNGITFGLFFKDTQSVNIDYTDNESGVKDKYYFVSNEEITDFSDVDWKVYDNSFNIDPNGKYVVYAKVVDKVGNYTISNSNGVVLYTDSTVAAETTEFDLSNHLNQSGITFVITANDNTLRDITVDNSTKLVEGTDYTVDGNKVTVKRRFFEKFSINSTPKLVFAFNPMGVEGSTVSEADVTINVIDCHKSALKTDYKSETCTEDGNRAYWYCDICSKYYADNNGLDASVAYNSRNSFVIEKKDHRNAVRTNAVAESCLVGGNKAYWYCPDCGKYFADNEGAIDKTTALADNTSFMLNPLGHKYTNYNYNGDATYFENGTETADCDHSGCTIKHTRECQNSKLIDSIAPKAKITVGENSWNDFLNNITFGLFFNETQSVSIDYTDNESGVKDKYYFVSNEEITDFNDVDWKVYDNSFNIDPNEKYVIYAMVVDKVGNSAIYNSNGLVLDSIAPKLSVSDGDVYCGEVTITVTEDNFDYLTVDGNRVDLTEGQFKLTDKETAQKIEVFDKAGNKTELSVTVNREHTFDESKITTPATVTTEGVRTYYCKYCDATHTEPVEKLPPKIVNGADSGYKLGSGKSLTFRSNASLADFVSVSVDGKVIDPENYTLSEGGTVVKFNADFLNSLSEGKHTLSINSTSGSATTEFSVAKDKIANGKKVGVSPKTGVRADYMLWLSLAVLLSADVLTSVVLLKRKSRSK